jgi:hypothetical protein
MITKEKARELFEEKMRWVEQQTGKNIKRRLEMAGGPEHAEIVYEQMFVCFFSGTATGVDYIVKGPF